MAEKYNSNINSDLRFEYLDNLAKDDTSGGSSGGNANSYEYSFFNVIKNGLVASDNEKHDIDCGISLKELEKYSEVRLCFKQQTNTNISNIYWLVNNKPIFRTYLSANVIDFLIKDGYIYLKYSYGSNPSTFSDTRLLGANFTIPTDLNLQAVHISALSDIVINYSDHKDYNIHLSFTNSNSDTYWYICAR